ncbi:anther-specific proline-rich protein APG-like [Tripterygium wilfordii]|uniref:Anther-specific proline-rich protein APG-like n=1 Tax=Tripterygium wilfordii TaxID=458696 RepID=A0A7J7D4E3_TRIWF|nr:GDSL esterase/lipase At3g48460-like [Tripterygium wilfordii]KAF5741129.1 anther-specific proline-rich protein APG-like [Tripterygium wilfordii]
MNSKHFINGLQVAFLVLFLSSSFSSAHLKLQPPPMPQPTPNPQTSIVEPIPNLPERSNAQTHDIPQPSIPQHTTNPQPTKHDIPQPSIPQQTTNPQQTTHDIPQPSIPKHTINSQPSTPQASPSGDALDSSISYQGTFKKVYAFGDSYTDTGNAKLLGGLKSFVTDLISKFASLADPNGGKNLPGSRLCNGKLVIDFLCDSLGLPTPPAYKDTSANFSKGVNFAISGSTGLSGDFFAAHKIAHALMWKAIPETFKTQLDWFTKHLAEVECKGLSDVDCKGSMNNSLFWVGEMGGNDYSRTLGSSISIPWLTEMNIGHVFNLVKTLIERGAKYLVVQGLPPAGCCPLQLALSKFHDRDGMGCASLANGLIKAHNKLLQKKLEILRKLFPHCVISYVDYSSAYKNVLSNHKQYNFQEPFKACCGAGGGPLNFDLHRLCGSVGTSTCKHPNQFINWDGVHLTEAMHKVLSDLFFHKPGFCQPPFLQLIKHKKGLLI